MTAQELMIGDEAAAFRAGLEITYPVDNGIIKNWDDMEHLWNYTFSKKLCVDTSTKRIVLTEPPMNPAVNREKMLEIMFEKYHFKAVYVGIQAMLTLYAQGTQRSAAQRRRSDCCSRGDCLLLTPVPACVARRTDHGRRGGLRRWRDAHCGGGGQLRAATPDAPPERRGSRRHPVPHQAVAAARVRVLRRDNRLASGAAG